MFSIPQQQQYEDEDQHLQQHIAYANPEQSQHQQQQEPEIIYHYVTEPPTDHHHHQHPHYVYGPPQQTSEAPHLPVHENYPSSKHTQVYFPTSGHRGGAESSLRPPQPFHPPMIYADGNHESHRPAHENYPPLHQQQQQQYEHDEGQPEGQNIQYQYVQEHEDTGAHENEHQIVSITQRPSSAATYAQQPYNYHAHQAAAHRPIVEQPVDAASYVSGPAPHSMSKGAKRQTATFSRQQQYQEKVTKLISHMKKKKAEASSVAAPKTIATGDSAEGASEFQITVVRRH